MDRGPTFPSGFLRRGVGFAADAAAMAYLFLSHAPLALKLLVGAVLALLPLLSLAFYFGQRHGWLRQRARIHDLERENRELRILLRNAAAPMPRRSQAA
jgi:hypothetical protein